MQLGTDQIAKYKPGTVAIDSFFWSSSKTEEATLSGNTLFVVEGVSGRDVSSLAMNPAEQEILFPFPFRFEVVDNTHDPIRKQWVITGHEA